MLAEICGYLNNYFDVERCNGFIRIQDGVVYCNDIQVSINSNQYFALLRKNFIINVYKFGKDELPDKEFVGAVWLMDPPEPFMSLVGEIVAWQDKYGNLDSASMSPFNSESFGGYTYSKGTSSSDMGGMMTWKDAFKSRLVQYRKVSLL